MNDFQMQQHAFQQQQFSDMRRHGVAASADVDAAIAAHRAAAAAIHAEYEARSLRMDLEFEERCAAMRSDHAARVAALRAQHVAPRTLDDINNVDDVRAYFARNR